MTAAGKRPGCRSDVLCVFVRAGGDALPTVPPDINLFEQVNLFSFSNNPGEIVFRGYLTSLNPVPEPATLSLLAAGLLVGAAFRKRFK